mmetsp:Transcript_30594/g.35154  ORF Transcript_30594/g.35154 Transcript_30594/m.35154 type:complete len:515 (-) Transcript_30594:247-1791(-)
MSTTSSNKENPAEILKEKQRKSTHHYEARKKYKKNELQPDIEIIEKIVNPSELLTAFDNLETEIQLAGKAQDFWFSEKNTFEKAFPEEFANMVEIRRKAKQVIEFNTNEIKPLVESALKDKHNDSHMKLAKLKIEQNKSHAMWLTLTGSSRRRYQDIFPMDWVSIEYLGQNETVEIGQNESVAIAELIARLPGADPKHQANTLAGIVHGRTSIYNANENEIDLAKINAEKELEMEKILKLSTAQQQPNDATTTSQNSAEQQVQKLGTGTANIKDDADQQSSPSTPPKADTGGPTFFFEGSHAYLTAIRGLTPSSIRDCLQNGNDIGQDDSIKYPNTTRFTDGNILLCIKSKPYYEDGTIRIKSGWKIDPKTNKFQDDSYRPADIPSPSNEEGRGFFVKAAHCVTSHVKSLEDINKRSQCRLREKDDKIYELKLANSRLKDDLEHCHRRDSGRKRRRTYDNSAVGRHNRNQFSDARSEHRRTSNGDNFPRIDEQENSSRTANGRHSYGSSNGYNF